MKNYEMNRQVIRDMQNRGKGAWTGKEAAAGGGGNLPTDAELAAIFNIDPALLKEYDIVEIEEPEEEVINVPISLTLVVIATYIFIGAVIFAAWNGWTWITGAYFSFVTLSTIGFGDLVPGWTKVGTTEGNLQMFASCFYIILGLAVLSMSFNLMMEEMIAKFTWLGRKLGIIDDPNASPTSAAADDKQALIENEKQTPIDTPHMQSHNQSAAPIKPAKGE